MIAFVIHNATDSSDLIMFAESFDKWWTNYINKHENSVFEKREEIKGEFGRIHCVEGIDEKINDYASLKEFYKNKKEYMPEPLYVNMYNITEELEIKIND